MELRNAPVEFYNGLAVPCNQKMFYTKFPGGLTCSCPSNFIFTELSKWKKHIKGKRHINYINSSEQQKETSVDRDKIIKQQKIQIGELSQKLSQAQIEINDLKSYIEKKMK